jgi:cytochrome c oxidase subunit III
MTHDPHAFRSAPPREPSFRISTAQLGMLCLLASLAMLFGGSLIAYLLTRSNNPNWSSVRFGLPWGLLVATLDLAAVSWVLESGVRAIRNNRQQHLQRALRWTFGLAVVFLLLQAFNWTEIKTLNPAGHSHVLALFSFYMLTGLHGLHVLGGMVPLSLVMQRAAAREYSSSRFEGVRLLAQYWHFLGVVWVVLVGCLLAVR